MDHALHCQWDESRGWYTRFLDQARRLVNLRLNALVEGTLEGGATVMAHSLCFFNKATRADPTHGKGESLRYASFGGADNPCRAGNERRLIGAAMWAKEQFQGG